MTILLLTVLGTVGATLTCFLPGAGCNSRRLARDGAPLTAASLLIAVVAWSGTLSVTTAFALLGAAWLGTVTGVLVAHLAARREARRNVVWITRTTVWDRQSR